MKYSILFVAYSMKIDSPTSAVPGDPSLSLDLKLTSEIKNVSSRFMSSIKK